MGKKKGYDISEAEQKTELEPNRETISFTSQDYDAILNRKVSDAIEEEDAVVSTENKENDGGIKRVSLVIVVGKTDNEDNQEQSTPSMDTIEPELIEDADYEDIKDEDEGQREENQVSSNEPVSEDLGCQIESVLDENGDSIFPQQTLDNQIPSQDSPFETKGVLNKEEDNVTENPNKDERKESVNESKPDSRRSTFKNQQFISIDLSENEKVEVKMPQKKKAIAMGKCHMRTLCFASVGFLIFLIVIVVCILATGHRDDEHRLARKANLPHSEPDPRSQSPENIEEHIARKANPHGFEPATEYSSTTLGFHSQSTLSEEQSKPEIIDGLNVTKAHETFGEGEFVGIDDASGDQQDLESESEYSHTNSTIYSSTTKEERNTSNERVGNEIDGESTPPSKIDSNSLSKESGATKNSTTSSDPEDMLNENVDPNLNDI